MTVSPGCLFVFTKQDDKRADQDLDVHVLPVWNQGITGKGVVVTILDDGKFTFNLLFNLKGNDSE